MNLRFYLLCGLQVSAAVIVSLVGCSKREDYAKTDQRAATATNTIPDWALEGSTNTVSASKTNLTAQQIAELKTKAEQGDAEAQYKLAVAFGAGDGVPRNDIEALSWTIRAAESGHAESAYKLALEYRYGSNRQGTNAALALRWLKVAAESGLVDAQRSLATAYRFPYPVDSPVVAPPGWGTGENKAEAAKWYLKAAEQGDASAQSSLGTMYVKGEGIPTNASEGLRLLEQAVAGYENKFREIENGTNFANLPATSRVVLAESAARSIASTSWKLGEYLYDGQFLPKNITNAIHWYEKAATPADWYGTNLSQSQLTPTWENSTDHRLETYYADLAQFQLGYIHATETKNYPEAVKWFRKRAESGDPHAQYNLAGLLFRGEGGVAQNWIEAVKWYRASAEQGLVGAQFELGLMIQEGKGVPRDNTESVKWFRKAAEQGHFDSQNNLGIAYARGEGVPRDYVEAYKWYNLAAAGGEDAEHRDTSRTNLNQITRYMTRDQIAEAQRRSSAFVAKRDSSKPSTFIEDDFMPKSSGTAFFITDDGFLLTCAHVVNPPEPKTAEGFIDARTATRIEITVAGKTHAAKLVKVDKANDVAVLKIAGNFQASALTPSRNVKLADTICTIGFPNTDIQGNEAKFTKGEISSLAGIQDDPRHFQISVAVQPGNSGGPLVDASGNVIGIVTARLGDIATLKITGSLPQNVNYALKSSFIAAFLETLPEVSAKLKSPRPAKERPLSEVAEEVKKSVVLVTVY